MTKTLLTAAATGLALTFSTLGAQAQTAGDLAQLRGACTVGQGNCLAFVRSFVARPGFAALSPANRAQVISLLATELRGLGVATQEALVDDDIEAALVELSVTTPDQDQAVQLTAFVSEIRDEADDEVPVGQFSTN